MVRTEQQLAELRNDMKKLVQSKLRVTIRAGQAELVGTLSQVDEEDNVVIETANGPRRVHLLDVTGLMLPVPPLPPGPE